MEIVVNKKVLKLHDIDRARMITIESENGCGLYSGKDENGNSVNLTRQEVKELGDIKKIDDTILYLRNIEFDRIYTNDSANFIDDYDYNRLDDEEKEEYQEVKFIVTEN